MRLSSVNVDAAGNITTAGISLESYAGVISYSSVTVGSADGIYIAGSRNTVDHSTAQANSAAQHAFYAIGGSTNTFSVILASNPAGEAFRGYLSANLTVDQSTAASSSASSAFVLDGSTGARVTQLYAQNTAGSAFSFTSGSNYGFASGITAVSSGAASTADLSQSSSYTFTASILRNSGSSTANALRLTGGAYNTISLTTATTDGNQAIYIVGSTANVFTGLYAQSNGTAGAAFHNTTGSDRNTIAQSTFAVVAPGAIALSIDGGSSCTVTGVFVDIPAGLALSMSNGGYSTVQDSTFTTAGTGVQAVQLNGTSDNILRRLSVNNPTGDALYVVNAPRNQVDHSTFTTNSIYRAVYSNNSSSGTYDVILASNPGGTAFYIYGGRNNLVSQSTMVSAGTAYAAFNASDSDSNTVTGSYLWSAAGYGALFDTTADFNTISQSTMVSGSASHAALYMTNSDTNTVTGSFLYNATGFGARLAAGADYNAIRLSTVVVNGAAKYALDINASTSNLVTGSYLENKPGTAVNLAAGADSNTITLSSIFSQAAPAAAWLNASNLNTISQSFIDNSVGYGLRLDGSNNNALSQSTVTAPGGTTYALFLMAASSNSVTSSYLSAPNGAGIYLQGESNYNTISQSVANSNTSSWAALFITGSSWNIITQSWLTNPAGHGAYIWSGSAHNTISLSTMTSAGVNQYALYIAGSSNTVSGSYLQGSTAAFVTASTGTVFNTSVLVATNTAGSALAFVNGGVNLTFTSGTLRALGRGLYLDSGNTGVVSLGSVTVTGASHGLEISTQGASFSLAVDSITFRALAPGATAVHFLGGAFVSTFTLANFEDASIGANVNAAALDLASRITMNAHYGVRTNPVFENDPNDLVEWEDLPKFAGCEVTRNVGAGRAYVTIQSAVNSLPRIMGGQSCVVIRDGGTYAEQVTVRNFTNNGSSITIFADPASGFTPVVSPPALSTAAFVIANASVNVQGIRAVITQDIPYGIYASSSYVTLSSVSVSTSGSLGIYTAGVRISSWSAVSYSSVTVWNAHGYWLDGSTKTTISYSTAVSNSATRHAVFLDRASSNTFTTILASNSIGIAFELDSAHSNTISLSTAFSMAPNLSAVHFFGTSSSNTFDQSYAANLATSGDNSVIWIETNASYNTISASTMSRVLGTINRAIYVQGSYNLIDRVYNPIAAYAGIELYGNFNTVSRSTSAGGTSGLGGRPGGISLRGNNNTLTADSLQNGLYVFGNYNTVNGVSATAGNDGALVISGGRYNAISGSMFLSGGALPAALIQIDGAQDPIGNTVVQSTIAGASGYGLFLNRSSSITIVDSYIQGSTAVYISGSTGTAVAGSVLVATNTIGSAVAFAGGSVNLTIATSTLRAPALGRGLALNPDNSGVVSLGSVTIMGAARGIEISTQAAGSFILAVDSVTFRGLATGATAIHFLGGTFVSTITLANFEDASIGADVSGAALGLASRITMAAHYGVRSGPAYENDPNGLVDWLGYEPYPGCAVTSNVGLGKPYATIMAGLAALPSTLPGHACVVISDGATYAEQVSVRNFTNNGSSITILADPASGLRPIVSPPITSTAAFVIANASVNIQGLYVLANQSIPYGVWASSGYVTLSSVTISTAGSLGIYTAGVRISSWSAISYSSVTVWNAHGIWLDGSTRTAVSFSTAVNNSATSHAVFLDGGKNDAFTVLFASNSNSSGNGLYALGSDTNTVTQSYVWGGLSGAKLDTGSNYNTISLSTMIGNTGNGMYFSGTDSNTVTQSYMWGGLSGAVFDIAGYSSISLSTMIGNASYGLVATSNGDSNTVTQSYMWGGQYGAYLNGGSDYNAIRLSTMIGNTITGFYVTTSASNTVTQSYMWGGLRGAWTATGSNDNAISLSTMIGNTQFGFFANATTSNTVTQSYMWGGQNGAALQIGSNYNTISLSTMVSDSVGNSALYINKSSSNTIMNSYVQGSTAALISGSTGTVIGGSILIATNTAGSALAFAGGGVNLTITTSTLFAPSAGRGLALNPDNVGVVSLSSVIFTGAARGIEISTQVTGSFSLVVDSITFRGLASGSTAVHFLGGTFVSTFTLANFEDASIGADVSAAALNPASRITMNAYSGARGGPAYENDPAGLVDWITPPFPGCTTTHNVGVGRDFPTISAAVAGVPSVLAGQACVIIRDGATYVEQVTVRNFTNNGSSITIFADPASGLRPVVAPPAASLAAFVIANASVNVYGLDIRPTNAMTYGVAVSSGYVRISSVNIQDAVGLITDAGVLASSWTTISYTSVTVGTAHAFHLPGSTMTTISYSTAQALGTALNANAAVLLDAGSSSNTITSSRFFIAQGMALRSEPGSSWNSISLSSMITNGGTCGFVPCPALYLNGASSSTISQSYIEGPMLSAVIGDQSRGNTVSRSTVATGAAGVVSLGVADSASNTVSDSLILAQGGYALTLDATSSGNLIVRSTITSAASGVCYLGSCSALHVRGSSNTLSLSYVQGSTAAILSGSTGTVISGSLFAATDAAGAALEVSTGSVGVSITTSTLIARSLGTGLALDAGNTGVVRMSSVIFSGAARGIVMSTQAAGFALSVDSVTFRALAPGATAVDFLGGTVVSTFTLANFEDATIAVNVNGAALGLASRVTMRAAYGTRQGPGRENDPNSLVDWPDLPVPSSPAIWFVALSSAGVQYGTVGADGYVVTASTAANFSGTLISTTVFGTQARLAPVGLDPNTTYYFKTGALWAQTTAYSPTILSTVTLAQTVAGTSVYEVFATSVVINWQALPVAPPAASSNSASGYVLEVSLNANFIPLADATYMTGTALSTMTMLNLQGGGTYYFRVGSLNWSGTANYALSVTTVTNRLPFIRPAQTPFGVAMSSVGVAVTLSWMTVQRYADGVAFADPLAATAAELTGFSVYRATSPVAATWTQRILVSSTTLTWTDVAGGAQYYYHVRSENASGPSRQSVVRAVGSLAAYAVAPDGLSYLEVLSPSVSPIEGVGGQPMTAYLVEASSRTEDLGGRVVKSIQFTALQGGLTPVTNFEMSGMGRLKLRYELGASSVIASGVTAAVPATPGNLGVYWYNGTKWLQMYGRLDQTDQTLSLETKYLGIYQLRLVERAEGFGFDQAGVSNRFVTPNGDGKNDTVVFSYDNPRDVSVRARILDLRGRVVVSELPQGPVTNSRVWDGRGAGIPVPSGVYLYQLEAEGRVYSGSIVILK